MGREKAALRTSFLSFVWNSMVERWQDIGLHAVLKQAVWSSLLQYRESQLHNSRLHSLLERTDLARRKKPDRPLMILLFPSSPKSL